MSHHNYSRSKPINMNKSWLLLFVSIVCFSAHAQVAINSTGAAPHQSAVLDISSNDKALIIPRMTFSQMSLIPSPTEGMLVFVTDVPSGTYQYKSETWERLISRSASIVNGGVFYGLNQSIHQNASQFWWDNTNNRLGVGTNTPLSSLSVTNTNFPASWIAADFGNPTGSRVLLGNLSGNPSIGAASSILTTWDTLAINPGGRVSLPFYSGTNTRLMSIKSGGVISTPTVGNGITFQNDSLLLGGTLSKNSDIFLDGKSLILKGGTTTSLLAVNSNLSTSIFDQIHSNTMVAQSFVTQTNGIISQISILTGSTSSGFTGYYELYEGNGFSGPVLATANVFIPPFNINTYVDIPMNVPITSGQTYTIRVNTVGGNSIRSVAANDNIAGILYFDVTTVLTKDLTLRVYESEPIFNLLQVDGPSKTVTIDGASSSFRVSSLGGTGTRGVVVSANGTLGASANPLPTVTSVSGTPPIQVTNGTTTPLISMPQASTSVAGYLAPGDFITFNNKQNALPNASASASGILTSADWNTFNNKQSTTSFASTSANGVLSSTDWNTFNDKQSTTSFATSTTNGVLTSTDWNTFNNKQSTTSFASSSANGVLSSTDWNTFNNKYNLPALTNGSVLFSNGSTIAQKNSHFFWDNTNNALGIGTNTPSAGLNIHGYGWNNGFRISQSATGGVGPAIFLDGDRDFAIISTSTGAGAGANKLNIYDATADQSRLVVDQNGSIGIGQNAPASKLDVNGTAGLKVSSSHNGSGYTDWVAANIGGQGDKRVVIGVFDTIATIGAHNAALNQWRSIAINPAASGNVGIGTTNPQYKLDVSGNQRVAGTIKADSVSVIGNINVTGRIRQNVHSYTYNINPFNEITYVYNHNLGYEPVFMTSIEQTDNTSYGTGTDVRVAYQHTSTNSTTFFIRNTGTYIVNGKIKIIVVN
jgi:hypothetical protein